MNNVLSPESQTLRGSFCNFLSIFVRTRDFSRLPFSYDLLYYFYRNLLCRGSRPCSTSAPHVREPAVNDALKC